MKIIKLMKLKGYETPLKSISISPRNLIRLFRGALSTLRSSRNANLPISIGIESSAVCNLRCKMCFTVDNMHRKKGIMKFDNFKKVIDEAKPLYLGLSNAGEPFLNKDIFKMIKYAKSKGIIVNLISNATLLNEETARKTLESGLDIIKFSVDSTHKDVYEKIRIGANFEETVSNIKKFVELKKKLNMNKPEISINMVVFKDNVAELDNMIRFCKEKFDTYPEFIPMFGYGAKLSRDFKVNADIKKHISEGIKEAEKYGFEKTISNLKSLVHDIESMSAKSSKGECFIPWASTTVTWDGNTFPCCHFINENINLGNVFEDDFMKVWNGRKYQQFRSDLLKKRGQYKQCLYCGMNDRSLYNLFAKTVRYFPLLRLVSKRKYCK